jgi:hypothetical protein
MNGFFGLICFTAAISAASLYGFADTADKSEDDYIAMAKMDNRQQQQQRQQQSSAPAFKQGDILPCRKYPAAFNAPASIKTKNWECCTVNVNASYIYWHASQESMDVAYVDPTAVLAFTHERAVAFQKFEYNSGFKVGIGLDTNFDGWAGSVEYTRLHQRTHSKHEAPFVTATGQQIYNNPDWFANMFTTNNAVSEVTSKWKLHFDMLDGVLSRPFYQGRRLTVSPYGGLRALWIEQDLDIHFLGTHKVVGSKSENESESWAIGPKFGACSHWLLGAGIRLQGNAAVSVLYTRYDKISHKESGFITDGSQVTDIGGAIEHFNVLRPIIDMGLGLGWGSYFADEKCYVDLSASYEFLYLFHQNVMRELVSTLQNRVDHVGDLQIHGLTVSGGVYF